MPERIFSEGLILPDGRKVRVLAYDDGSVRFRLDGTPYVMEEAFLAGGRNDHAIIKLAPRSAASVADDLQESNGDPLALLRAQVAALRERLSLVEESDGEGRIIKRHQREAADAAWSIILMMLDQALEARAS